MSVDKSKWYYLSKLNKKKRGREMIRVGIDISKEKSTVCMMRPFGEMLKTSEAWSMFYSP